VFPVGWRRMKQILLMIAVVGFVGCGKKEPELRSDELITPDEAANQLFVEAIELVSKAKSEENTNIPAAIKSYEEALVKVRKIVNEYKKSDLAVKLVSGETLFTGKSMEQIEERVGELQRRAEEEKRRAEEMRKARAKHQLWEFETGGVVYSSPAIGSDGTVYVGSWDNKLYAINGTSGVKLWEFETGGNVSSSPAIGSDGTVYVGSQDKKLYAINGKSGVKLWEFETGSDVTSSPTIGSDGTVYVGSYDNKLYAIKTESKGPAKSPWPMRGQNARHTGRASAK
jgi:hypothetical protein